MALPPVTRVRIYNRALALLGSTSRTSDIDDGRPCTDTFNELWPDALRAVLAEHPWNCCIHWAQLNRGDAHPVRGHYYQLPADCLRWLPFAEDSRHHVSAAQEGAALVADAGPQLPIRYIRLIDDPSLWPPHLVDAMAARLAMDGAEALTQSTSIVEDMRVKYEGTDGEGGALARARRADGLATGDRDRGNVVRLSRALGAAYGGYHPAAPGR